VSDEAFCDDLFHRCALRAFVEQAEREQSWPDPEATRRLAYRLYEGALAASERNRHATYVTP
jgi:hypothetical protein